MEDYWRHAATGKRRPFEWSATDPPGADSPSRAERALKAMAGIPEEQIWLEARRSVSTRRAYAGDMAQFVAFLGIHTTEELRLVERAAIIAFQRHLEAKGFRPSSISRKITTLSSLFSHLVCHRLTIWNPCRELRRPPSKSASGLDTGILTGGRPEATRRPRSHHAARAAGPSHPVARTAYSGDCERWIRDREHAVGAKRR